MCVPSQGVCAFSTHTTHFDVCDFSGVRETSEMLSCRNVWNVWCVLGVLGVLNALGVFVCGEREVRFGMRLLRCSTVWNLRECRALLRECRALQRLLRCSTRGGAGVEYHFQELNEPYAPS